MIDTDHMSLIERGGIECERILNRLRDVPPDDVATTVVSYEEQMRGWLSRLSRASKPERQILDYAELKRLLRVYCDVALLEYDAKAVEKLQELRKRRIRIGTMDRKIAAIALANDALLLTRNATDFSKVPDLRFEDWSL